MFEEVAFASDCSLSERRKKLPVIYGFLFYKFWGKIL